MSPRILALLAILAPSCVIYTEDPKLDTGGGSSEPDEGLPDSGGSDGVDGGGDTAGDTGEDTGGEDTASPVLDADGDGWLVGEDCDDTRSDVNPAAAEICDDGLDNNCDGSSAGCELRGELEVVDVAETIFQGEAAGDHFGLSLASGGDVDGDGDPDILISRTGSEGGNPASVHLFHSPTSGFVNAGAADATLSSSVEADGFGMALSALGDMDGDGYGDFAVGAPFAGSSGSITEDAVGVFIFAGPMSGSISALTAEATFAPHDIGDLSGWRVSGLPDMTGDGVVDLLVSAPGASVAADDHAGKVYLLAGPWRRAEQLSDAVATFTGEIAGAEAGRGAALGVGDIDGDGQDDILISSPSTPVDGYAGIGAAWLITRPASGQVDLAYADARIYGLAEGERFGHSAVGLGDTDGDGYGELLIGAPDADLGARNGGAAYVFSGADLSGDLDVSDAQFAVLGAMSDGETGLSVASPGDFDGDGNADLAVSDPRGVEAGGVGVTALLYGPVAGNSDIEDADLLIFSDRLGDDFGASLAGVGDTDGDAQGDLLIGASLLSPTGTPEAGGAWLLRGTGR